MGGNDRRRRRRRRGKTIKLMTGNRDRRRMKKSLEETNEDRRIGEARKK